MTKYLATIALNRTAPFKPFAYGEKLDTVAYLAVHGDTPQAAAEQAWEIANRVGADDVGDRYPTTQRSASVGDVILLGADGGEAHALGVTAIGYDTLDLSRVDRSIIVKPYPTQHTLCAGYALNECAICSGD